MRKLKAKKIRNIIGFDFKNPNPILRRTYRRLKKLYSNTPDNKKQSFIESLQLATKGFQN